MNKRQILASLNKIANELDTTGLHKEANTITKVMVKLAQFNEDLGGDDPNIAREFDATENANRFMTNDYTIILINADYNITLDSNEEVMRVPASRVIDSYNFNIDELAKALWNAGLGPGKKMEYDDEFSDRYMPKIDRKNKTISMIVKRDTGKIGGASGRITTNNPEFEREFYDASLSLRDRKRRERTEKKEMDAYYPEI